MAILVNFIDPPLRGPVAGCPGLDFETWETMGDVYTIRPEYYLLDSNQYLTMAAKESGLRLAPPTRAPSISS